MDYAYEIRRQAEAAPRAALPAVTAALWKVFGEGHLSETEAEALSGLIEARQLTERPTELHQRSTDAPRKAVGSRPRTDGSMARRRRWAASGRLPPALAAQFTLAEQSVLAVVAVEVAKRGDCRLAVGHIAAVAGVSETMVRNALREARRLGHVTVEERRVARFRNDTNVVCVVSREWMAWLRLARSVCHATVLHQSGGGCRSSQGTNTPVSYPVNSEGWRPHKGCRMVEGDLAVRASPGMRQGRVRA
ncbi:helix-turn-helix domain-containing protein [Methylobacterium sp. WL119]|uniref:helix-turn-helix domain-containing protein n=1 Tax=unclassified Methylobacterium TaxID=2615210 RepID=UPI0011CBD1D1|nr:MULTISPECIES: helix-turn-helix domain-containing protein [unclassified Methylobacterium]TXN32740.1 helix-turn-helix domain-containing protein [Methylobacterium sp. WL93]TXN47439.1 helix-turn-helix domain-containing protein [Methylobacterium sp. WL119]